MPSPSSYWSLKCQTIFKTSDLHLKSPPVSPGAVIGGSNKDNNLNEQLNHLDGGRSLSTYGSQTSVDC